MWGFMGLSLLHVSRKFTEVSESISGLLVSGHPWGRGRGEDSEDSPGWVDRSVFNYRETINIFAYTFILEILPGPP